MGAWIEKLAERRVELRGCLHDVMQAFEVLKKAYQDGGMLMVCGNGGSASDAEHIVGELMKGFLRKRSLPEAVKQSLDTACPEEPGYLAGRLQGALPAISLASSISLGTAIANDISDDMVFAQQVYGYGTEGDVLLAISTSGSSLNVVRALQVAKAMRLRTIGLTGPNPRYMRELCDVLICVPGDGSAEIQEGHQAIYHTLCAMLEEAFFPA